MCRSLPKLDADRWQNALRIGNAQQYVHVSYVAWISPVQGDGCARDNPLRITRLDHEISDRA